MGRKKASQVQKDLLDSLRTSWSVAHQAKVILEQALQGKEFKPHPKSLLFVTAEIHLEAFATNMPIPKTSADCRSLHFLVINCHLPRPPLWPQIPNQWHLVSQTVEGLRVHRSPRAHTKLLRTSRNHSFTQLRRSCVAG